MATPLTDVYDVFLSKVEADDWMETEDLSVVEEDWRKLLDIAIFRFRYSRVDLNYSGDYFTETLSNDEKQILATLMKHEWVKRCISTWDNIRQLYSDRDFSPAASLTAMQKTEQEIAAECRYMLDLYGRATNYKPDSKFGQLAGK